MSPREEPVHVVRLAEPVVDGQRVTFAFAVAPATELYARTAFHLDVPASIDLAGWIAEPVRPAG